MNNFRTKLDKTLEKQLSQFEYLKEIQSLELDVAFEKYLRGPYMRGLGLGESDMVFSLINKGGLLGFAVEAHEKWEVLEYLKKSYSLEDISDGKAHKEHKPYAHAEARFKEYSIYRFLYEKQFNKKSPPIYAFLLVTPSIEIFGEGVHKVDLTVDHLEYLIKEYGKHKDSILSEKCSKQDLKNAMKFFEKNGYEYKDMKKMLRRAEEFIKNHS